MTKMNFSNKSEINSANNLSATLLLHSLNFFLGIWAIVANTIILLCFVKFKSLRKQAWFTFIAILAIADGWTVKGQAAVDILEQEDIINAFADEHDPIPLQILSSLGFILNSYDESVIREQYEDHGARVGGSMLRAHLIQQYSCHPETFTMKQLIDVLIHLETNFKLRDLLRSACYYAMDGDEAAAYDLDLKMIKEIKANLQLICENVQKVWGRLLNETSLEKCFVEPEIVEEEIGEQGELRKKETGKYITTYKELFDTKTLSDRIVIDGDPGMGKTTYVDKLALESTQNERSENSSENTRYLQSKFTTIFLIPLRSLNGGRASTFAEAASIQLRNCGSWLSSKFQSSPIECLLILDAFDEYDGSCDEINDIINGSRLSRLKVIITTRPSHIDRLEIKNQWLSITGLTTSEKREQFLIKQGWNRLDEREMVTECVLSGFGGTMWHNPLHLAMLCVLHNAHELTGFDPRKPDCFYVLVKLFTEHIISRKSNEGTLQREASQLTDEERLKLKAFVQKYAIDQFSQSNPWFANAMKTWTILNFFCWMANAFEIGSSSSDSGVIGELAGQFGLIIIRQERSPVTGQCEETISLVHQLFLEYYAAVEFGIIFSSCMAKDHLFNMIRENLDISTSPMSYFLAAECKEYKAMLVKVQKCVHWCPARKSYRICKPMVQNLIKISKFYSESDEETFSEEIDDVSKEDEEEYPCECENDISSCKSVNIMKFPWIPDIQIFEDIFKNVPVDVLQKSLTFKCDDRYVKFFWDLEYVKELCSIAKPRVVEIHRAVLGYHDKSLDYILTSVEELDLVHCNSEHVGLEKQYPNLIKFTLENICMQSLKNDDMALLNHFPNLHELHLQRTHITAQSIDLLCDSLRNMNHLQRLKIQCCFVQLDFDDEPESVKHVIQLANTIETSSLCQSLKELNLHFNALDAETESSSDILMGAVSKCVQLEVLVLSWCQIKVQSLDIIKEIIKNSPHIRNNLKVFHVSSWPFAPLSKITLTNEDLNKWKSDIKLILPNCLIESCSCNCDEESD